MAIIEIVLIIAFELSLTRTSEEVGTLRQKIISVSAPFGCIDTIVVILSDTVTLGLLRTETRSGAWFKRKELLKELTNQKSIALTFLQQR